MLYYGNFRAEIAGDYTNKSDYGGGIEIACQADE